MECEQWRVKMMMVSVVLLLEGNWPEEPMDGEGNFRSQASGDSQPNRWLDGKRVGCELNSGEEWWGRFLLQSEKFLE